MKQVYNNLTSEYDWLTEAKDINFAQSDFNTPILELYLNGTAGNDLNDGLSAITPKKTFAAIGVMIPVVAGSLTRIHVARNTVYPNTYFNFPNVVATNNTYTDDFVRSVVYIEGDTDDASTVVFSPTLSTDPCFVNDNTNTLVILSGISGSNCSSLLETRNAYSIVKGLTVTNYTDSALLVDHGYLKVSPVVNSYTMSSKTGAGETWGIKAINNSYVSIDTGTRTLSVTNFESTGGALFADFNSHIEEINVLQDNVFTANVLTGASHSVLSGENSNIKLNGTTAISNINLIDSNGYGALRADAQGKIETGTSTLISFTNCLDAISVGNLAAFVHTSTCVLSFTTVTRQIVLEHGSIAKTSNAFGGAVVTYIEGQSTYHGYDDRYVNGPDLGDPVTITHGGTGSTTGEYSPTANASVFNYYVSTTGNDASDGLTVGTAFLTIEKALNSIPLLMGRVYQINIASGSYTLTDVYNFRPHISSFGDADNVTVIKIVGGDITNPALTLIKGLTSTTNCFVNKWASLLVDIDGIQFDTCASALRAEGGQFLIRGVNVNQYTGTAILANNRGIITTDTGLFGGVLTAATGVTTSGVSASAGSITVSKPTFTVQGFNGSSTGCSVSSGGSLIFASTTLNVTADLATGSRFGISASSGGTVSLRNTVNISNVSVISAAGDGGIRAFGLGTISMVASSTVNFVNCHNGWSLDSMSRVTEGNACTYNYTTVTTKVYIAHGAVVDSTNFLGATGSIVYHGSTFAGPLFGYDDRYLMVDRPTAKTTTISSLDYTVLVTDNVIQYDSILAGGNTVTLPNPVTALVDITSGQVRYFEVKDISGSAATNPITLVVTGGLNIDDSTTYYINQNNGSVRVYTDGVKYYVESSYKTTKLDSLSMNSVVFDIYVSTLGSDSNNGTATHPLLTFGEALNRCRTLGKGVTTIHLADGTYNETIKMPSFLNAEYDLVNSFGNNVVYVTGNILTPSNVKIIGSGVNTTTITMASNRTQFVFDGVQIEHSGTGVFRTGFSLSDANLILRNVDFTNIDRAIVLSSKSRLVTQPTGNARTWSLTGSSSAVSGVVLSSGSIWFDQSNINISGILGYGISVGSYCLYGRTGDTVSSIAANILNINGNVTSGCQGGIYVSTEGMFQLSRVVHVTDARNEQSKNLRAAAIVLDKGGKLEFRGNCSTIAEDCNTIISTSPQSILREVGGYSSYIALGSTPNTVSISPGTQMGMSRIGNSNLPQFSNITLGSGIAVYDTNPDTIVVASRLSFPSVTGGPFIVGETVTGGTSGATGIVDSSASTSILYRMSNGNTFIIGETITGSNIGSTAILSQVTEYNLLTKNNIQVGDIISFSYDQAIYTNAFNTFTVSAIDRSVITLNIGDVVSPHGYGPGTNIYTVGKVVAEQATKESTISFASDSDPYIVEEFEHVGLLPSSTTAYFARSGSLSSNASPLHVPHVDEEIWDLQVQARVAPGAGQTDTYTVMVNGVATAASVTLSGATQTYNGVKLDTPISITCGKINTIYEVGGGGVLTDLLNRGFFTGSVKSSFNLGTTAGVPDTFTWDERNSVTGAIITSGGPTAITGGWQLLADGVYIRFTNTTGHVSQFWNFSCIPADVITIKAVTGSATLSEDVSVAVGLIRKQVL